MSALTALLLSLVGFGGAVTYCISLDRLIDMGRLDVHAFSTYMLMYFGILMVIVNGLLALFYGVRFLGGA